MCTCSFMHKVCFNCLNIETTDHLCPLWSNNIFGNFPQNHRVHGVATATFWRTFHHDGNISPVWWGGGGVHAHPLLLYLPSRTKKLWWEGRYTPPIYFCSIPIFTLCSKQYCIPGNMQGIGRRIILCMWKWFRNKKMRECYNSYLCTVHMIKRWSHISLHFCTRSDPIPSRDFLILNSARTAL